MREEKKRLNTPRVCTVKAICVSDNLCANRGCFSAKVVNAVLKYLRLPSLSFCVSAIVSVSVWCVCVSVCVCVCVRVRVRVRVCVLQSRFQAVNAVACNTCGERDVKLYLCFSADIALQKPLPGLVCLVGKGPTGEGQKCV